MLGSGGPRAFGRGGSSYIVVVDGTPRILLDAGPGAFVRLGELSVDLEKVDIVLLTHLHIDHSSICRRSSTREGLPAADRSRIACLVRTGRDSFRRLHDLLIAGWELTGRLLIKKRLGRANRLPFATWRFAWIHHARKLWMTTD